MAVFHNYPSGNPTPSREDIEMTKKIKNVTEIFEIELLDHFVVGKEKTLSFSQEVSGFQSGNLIYQDKLEQMLIVKEDKSIYDREKVTLKVVDRIETALSDETIVLDIDKDNTILFDGRQFVEVYGIQSNNRKFFWNQGNYSDNYPEKKDTQIIDEDYYFADFYPLEKFFNDIDFIDWVEATDTNLSKSEKVMDEKTYNKERKKESTIAKLNKLKDRVAKDSIEIQQKKKIIKRMIEKYNYNRISNYWICGRLKSALLFIFF